MNFDGGKTSSAKDYLKLTDGQSVRVVLAGELNESSQHWVNKKPIDCTGVQCPTCDQMTPDKTPDQLKDLKPRFRFQVNAIMNENGVFVAKKFGGGWSVYSALKDLNEGGYDLEKHLITITRKGMDTSTKYIIMPVPNGMLTEEQLAQVKAVKLHSFGPKESAPVLDQSEQVPFQFMEFNHGRSKPAPQPLESTEPITLVCQLNKVTTTRDGGSRLVLDCGAESLKAIQRIQGMNAAGDVSLAIAVQPFRE